MCSLYPGACEFGDMRSRFLYIRDMLVSARGKIDRFLSNSRNQGYVNRARLSMMFAANSKMKLLPSLFSCVYSRVKLFVFARNNSNIFDV